MATREGPREAGAHEAPTNLVFCCFCLKKNVCFQQKHNCRCLVGAGLSGSLSCCHFLCDLSRGSFAFASYTHSRLLFLSWASLLRRDPQTSFFALFSEGFSDPRVYRYHMETRSGEAFFATSKTVRKRSYRVRGMQPPQGPAFVRN